MFGKLDVLLVCDEDAPLISRHALQFVARSCEQMGARLFAGMDYSCEANGFYDCTINKIEASSPLEWAQNTDPTERKRIVLFASEPGTGEQVQFAENTSAVFIETDRWQTETTLFAEAGLASLLGSPDKEPLVPKARYAAHTIGYAALMAICALHTTQRMQAGSDIAIVNGLDVLVWVNWKAAEAGSRGVTLFREGMAAEWPVLECKDGFVALIFTEREWERLVDMVGDKRLSEPRFSSYARRAENRQSYINILQDWVRPKTHRELSGLFLKWGVPGAPVLAPQDLPNDPLLKHQKVFQNFSHNSASPLLLPKLPHQIVAEVQAKDGGTKISSKPAQPAGLPLAGFRVLDLGIITAGAGIAASLADLGAEVLKIESQSYPDPFRMWAGADKKDSSVFKFNNRNKYGLDINLKDEEGIRTFLKLVASADIVLENFRRGVLDRLGLTFDVLRSANPSILLASISSQGHDGPGSRLASFGSTLEANSGFSSLTTYADGVPQVSGRNLNYPDQIVCLYAGGIITAAAADCRLNSIARHVDISQRECSIYQIGDVIADVSSADNAPYLDGIYQCLDDIYIAISCLNSADAPDIPGIEPRDEARLRNWLSSKSFSEIEQAFSKSNCGAVKASTGIEIFENQRFWRHSVFANSPSGEMVKGFPFMLRNRKFSIWADAPSVGQHNNKFLVPETK